MSTITIMDLLNLHGTLCITLDRSESCVGLETSTALLISLFLLLSLDRLSKITPAVLLILKQAGSLSVIEIQTVTTDSLQSLLANLYLCRRYLLTSCCCLHESLMSSERILSSSID